MKGLGNARGSERRTPAARTAVVGEEGADQRVDNFLLRELKGVPRSHIYRLLRGGEVRVNFLDYGCVVALDPEVVRRDRELWYGILHEDAFTGAERFRMALAEQGLLVRADTMASTAHRDWERALAAPLSTHGSFRWTRGYAAEFAEVTRRVLAQGGIALPAPVLLLWRQRLGVAAVIGMLEPELPFRRLLVDQIGTGRKALR